MTYPLAILAGLLSGAFMTVVDGDGLLFNCISGVSGAVTMLMIARYIGWAK